MSLGIALLALGMPFVQCPVFLNDFSSIALVAGIAPDMPFVQCLCF